MGQRIFPLDEEMSQRLSTHRDWVWDSVSTDRPIDREDPGTALSVITALLNDGIRPDETWKLQSLGVVLGDVMSRLMSLPWVVVDDEYGRDPALDFGGVGNLLFPLTMISKRVEAGETVDVYELVSTTAQAITQGD
ncbi:MAG: DUF3806 domain-containing protein [Pseudolysinimonas sp.]